MTSVVKALIPISVKNAIKRWLKNKDAVSDEEVHQTWAAWLKPFNTNPFDITPGEISREEYLRLAEEASARRYPEFMQRVEARFDSLPDKAWIDELALSTQVVKKSSKLLYVHGYLLYAALTDYIKQQPDNTSLTILETGTARGFSSVCLAKALDDAKQPGRILTIDVLPATMPLYWNCIHDVDGKKTRFELLQKWSHLVQNHVTFIQGFSSLVMRQLGLSRIHFAFLDGEHTYQALSRELRYVSALQQPMDMIICDDYTPDQFPGVVQAVDEFLLDGTYDSEIFQTSEGRGYVVLQQRPL